jgi:hypothetical protein
MNKKDSFTQAPAYLTKVKKDVTKGASKSQRTEPVQEKRHEKINFKQYLRDLQESQSSVKDEFEDIIPLSLNAAVKHDVRDYDDSLIEHLRLINFGGAEEFQLAIKEGDWELIADLQLDESMTVYSDSDERWYVTRSPSNHLVFECHELNESGKFEFTSVVKRLS